MNLFLGFSVLFPDESFLKKAGDLKADASFAMR